MEGESLDPPPGGSTPSLMQNKEKGKLVRLGRISGKIYVEPGCELLDECSHGQRRVAANCRACQSSVNAL